MAGILFVYAILCESVTRLECPALPLMVSHHASRLTPWALQ